MQIKALLFDFDDTLVTTFETKKEALKYLGREYYNIEIADELIKANWGKPIKTLFEALFNGINDIDKAIENYSKLRVKFPTVAYPDTLSTLQNLSQNFLLGIITSNRRDYLNYDLALSGINEQLFFVIQTAEESKIHKPDPRVFDYALQLLHKKGIDKSEIVYIGDTLIDYQAAKDAGLGFYGLPDRTVAKEEFDKIGAKTIHDISELIKIHRIHR